MMRVRFHRRWLPTRRVESFRVLSGGCVSGVLWVGLTLAGLFSAEARAQQLRTVRDGVYTAPQARRGQATFRVRCASCHGDRLGGGTGPALVGEGSLATWDKLPLADLIDKIEVSMPQDGPGVLTRQQATDLVAYLLQFRKFPVGQAELGADEAVLKEIAFDAAAGAPSSAAETPPAAPITSPAPQAP